MIFVFVDLDRTFIRCNSFSRELRTYVRKKGLFRASLCILSVPRISRLSIKKFIYTEIHNLEYAQCVNTSVLEIVLGYKSQGSKIILATAAVEESAKRIVEPFGCFDEVIGSKGDINLKGKSKLAAIADRVQGESFVYIGDSKSDFVIFNSSVSCILVTDSRHLGSQAQRKFGDKVRIIRAEGCKHAEE